MKYIKVLFVWFFAAMILFAVNSCGVPDPTVPVSTAVPANTSTIENSDSITITFSTSMTPGSLTMSGDMASMSDGGVWSKTRTTNDTLTIKPGVASGGVWTAGSHTLVIDVVATSGVPLSTLTLNYTVASEVPVATPVTVSSATFIGSDIILIFFSVEMDPSTLVLTGDMAVESDGGTWSSSNNTNDFLVIRPSNFWTGTTDTLIINVDSAAGVPLSPLTLNYIVDTTIPVAIASPADGAAINNMTPIVVSFTNEMNTSTLQLAGSMAIESDGGVWTSNINSNDTLTISPLGGGAWTGGAHTLVIAVDASNGIPLSALSLDYTVDDALPTASVTPVTGSSINGGQSIEIVFSKSMDITSLTASGTLWANADHNVIWSTTTNVDDTLTISPVSSWPVQTIDLMLDILDLVGNSLTIPVQNYIVDVTVPTITLLGNATEIVGYGTMYVDAGATALDNLDGDISGNIIVAGDMVDVNMLGTYVITYNVTDAAGNPAIQVTRNVTVEDQGLPVITAPADITVAAASASGTAASDAAIAAFLAGATATDNVDPTLTITNDAPGTFPLGATIVTFSATDSGGNTGTAQATVTVADQGLPVITAPADITVAAASASGTVASDAAIAAFLAGATATDNVDPTLTITNDAPGTFPLGATIVTFSATDSGGNTGTAQATVTVSAFP